MSRPAGRRVAERPRRASRLPRRPPRAPRTPRPATPRTPGRPHALRAVVLALVLVVVGVGALAWASDAHRATQRSNLAAHATRLSRVFACGGGIPGAKGIVGRAGTSDRTGLSVDGGAIGTKPLTLGATPLQVVAAPGIAPSAYAERDAAGKAWFAASGCPSPRADWWLVGAGGSGNHATTVEIANPRQGSALVDVDVYGPHGAVKAPGLHGIQVSSGGSVRLDLSKDAPALGDLAVHVRADRGLVTVSGPETWAAGFGTRSARGWVADQPSAERRLVLVGLAADPATTTALIANPSSTEAVVSVAFVGSNGTFAPTHDASVRVPPDTVLPVRLGDAARSRPLAVRLTSQVPITATVRTTRRTDDAYASVGVPIGASSVVGLPRSVPATLDLVAGRRAARVQVVGYSASGRTLGTRTVAVAARGARSTLLWPQAASIRVSGARGVMGSVVLGRPHGATVAALPLSASANESLVPGVREGW